ncbi:PaaI family thioesterase [Cognatishimia sp. SS12]|uniref:PaaI family thioesterase n=1 Tax=Cognatishimia sp. SS12 TaxID=2979465 RepID=UPI003FA41AEB
MTAMMTREDVTRFLAEVFPQMGPEFVIDLLARDRAVMRLRVADQHLRPGGTVSGPSMFALADVAAYVATLARIGPKALAVTTHCSIDFMRKPAAGQDLIAEAEVLKLGRALAVISVRLRSEGQLDLVAIASLTYSIPPDKPAA